MPKNERLIEEVRQVDWEGLYDFYCEEHTAITIAIILMAISFIASVTVCWLVARKNRRKDEARTKIFQRYITKKISDEELEKGLEGLRKK